MGGRGSKSPQAKRHVANVSSRALLWAKQKSGVVVMAGGHGMVFFSLRERRSAICLSSMLSIMEIQKKSLSHLHHPGLI